MGRSSVSTMAEAKTTLSLAENECQQSVRHKGKFKNPWPDWKFAGMKEFLRWQIKDTNYSKVPSKEVTL